jgi:carbon storage regulator
MLVLSRKNGEEIFIDNAQIIVKVIFAKDGKALLGIHAPQNIDIDRKEIFLRKQQDKIL